MRLFLVLKWFLPVMEIGSKQGLGRHSLSMFVLYHVPVCLKRDAKSLRSNLFVMVTNQVVYGPVRVFKLWRGGRERECLIFGKYSSLI